MHTIFFYRKKNKLRFIESNSQSTFNYYNIIDALNGMFNNVVYSFVIRYYLLADSGEILNLTI